jgi:hypothetical protein
LRQKNFNACVLDGCGINVCLLNTSPTPGTMEREMARITITREDAALRMMEFANEGRLIQNHWHEAREDGRELACLLGAIHPDVTGPSDCPASVMPNWMAELLLTLFDGVSMDKATNYGRRFSEALRVGNTDDSVLRKFLIATVEFAVTADALANANANAHTATHAGARAADAAADAAYAAAHAAAAYAAYAAAADHAARAAYAAGAAAHATACEHMFDALINAMLIGVV